MIKIISTVLLLTLSACNQNNSNSNTSSQPSAAPISRLNDPYWTNVVVDQVRAREESNKGIAHIIEGTNFQIQKTPYGVFTLEKKNGNREAFVSIIDQPSLLWIVDCENKLLKNENDAQWEEIKPGTIAGRVLVNICNLPSFKMDY
jgi:hypothetical protein